MMGKKGRTHEKKKNGALVAGRTKAAAASGTHPTECACGCNAFPLAMYRNYNGVEMFTGILQMDKECNLWKMDDPNFSCRPSNLGPGRKMSDFEFMSEMQHYDGGGENVKKLKTIPLIDFKSRPGDFPFTPSEEEKMDVKFPHGQNPPPLCQGPYTIPQIRADDLVKVVAFKHNDFVGRKILERVWVHVGSVTATGIVTGCLCNTIEHPGLRCKNIPDDMSPDPTFDVKEGDFLSFKVTQVFGVQHGKNW